jgi:hypothetical protein
MAVDVSVRAGTASGMLLSMAPNIHSEDIVRTAVLAGVGAVVGFCVTLFLKFVFRKRSR